MPLLLAANNANSTLAGSISNTATSANLAAGSGVLFPSPASGQYFIATFISASNNQLREIVHVTAVSADTITIVRAQEGTTALAWNAGDLFSNNMTVATLEMMQQSVSYAGNPNGNVAGAAATGGFPPTLCYDTVNSIFWFCTTSGVAASAVWSPLPDPITRGGQLFTSSGTFTVPTGVFAFKYQMWSGGGGGGGAATNGAGAGGNGGAYVEGFVTNATPAQGYTITVGGAGAAATAGNNAGGTGGTSSIALGASTLASATGGGGGNGGGGGTAGSTGAAATATGGSFTMGGFGGQYGTILTSGSLVLGGTGASAPLGGQGALQPGCGSGTVGGNIGGIPGGGGGGGASITGNVAGGAGAPGRVYITW